MSDNMIGWMHTTDESDQWDGFNDSGIEHFRGKPIFHLAREINQNALDAAEDGLVKVDFRIRKIETNLVPNLNEFKETIECCQLASKNESPRAELFFEHATGILNKKHLSVLEISDSNTKGIKGPAINGKPYYAFMKATGQSKKESETASGSYGIGKFAPYAVSNLRTIFVSTIYFGDDRKWHQLTQGKAVLMSHNHAGKTRRGVGFWGYRERCRPIEGSNSELAGWLQRAVKPKDYPTQKGTTINILGFEPQDNWRELLSVSVAENFFGAIVKGRLEVNIDDQIILSQDTINEFFERQEMRDAVKDQEDEPERFDNCKAYLRAIYSRNGIPEDTENRYLGKCSIRLLIGDDLPKKVCILRNGMLITDELNRLKSFPDFKEFVAVVECNSVKGNQFLREMEPPRHDNFEPERLPDNKKETGKKALSELAKWTRSMLKRYAKDPVSDITRLDELKDFFGDELSSGEGKGTEEINPIGEIIIRARPLPRKSIGTVEFDNSREQDDEGEGGGFGPLHENGGSGGEGSGNGNIPGRGIGDGQREGGHGGQDNKALTKLINVRAIIISKDTRRISFTPTVNGNVSLRLMRAGADADDDVKIIQSNKGLLKGGCVIVNVKAGNRTTLDIKMGKIFDGSIKVSAYEI